MQVALDPHLLDREQIIVSWVAQIEVAQRLDALIPIAVGPLGAVAVAQ